LLFVISGVQAAGKSTVARLLATRFPRGVCVPGDAIRAMIVSGRLEMTPHAGEEAIAQLLLRYAGALAVAAVFMNDGYDVVIEDVIVGPVLRDFLALAPAVELHLIFLDPDAHAIADREASRDKNAYSAARFSIDGLQRILREETDRIGLWLDSTDLTAEQTVDRILADPAASLIKPLRLAAAPNSDQAHAAGRKSARCDIRGIWLSARPSRRSPPRTHPGGIPSDIYPFIHISGACRRRACPGPSLIMGQKGANTVPATQDHGHHRCRIPLRGIPGVLTGAVARCADKQGVSPPDAADGKPRQAPAAR
jgi:predicted kinase